MKPLISLLIRIACGERLEKANAEDYRWWFGYFFFSGLLIMGVFPAEHFLDHASTVKIWLSAIITFVAFAFALMLWVQRVPAKISLALGIVAWGAVVWLFLRKTL
jgi:hypothetical protein